ncbi:cytochrome c biogenesis protein ResB [Cutibacterium equinum]|uniref:Cytochrome c biogenesis protein ResB n=1 Tax=Cutibacterium equinum TaxID=3016342 RepID=A0ABY7QYX4_9ACTN|nr:cytochrome c biogenesis protein ResB [Cutibacterium equinum]WCC80241.1 cytochrome c biogenesis protein ResB [Cutibacterium equinum]
MGDSVKDAKVTGSKTATSPRGGGGLGLRASLRWVWGQLTSMRTALILLFLLALAAIPGSMVPQSASSAIQVSDFAANHPTLDRIYRPLGMYHVYTSVWFSAIYLLLFISLIGCIIPRITSHVKSLRRQPPRVPARLDRLAAYASTITSDSAEEVGERAQRWLKSRRFRFIVDDDGSIRAEAGRHRETGNLIFHVFLVFLLIGVGWNTLWGFKGTSVVVAGQGFSNNITQYDDFKAGAMVDTDNLAPFSLKLRSFTASFETGTVQRGAARSFDATVDFTVDGKTQTRDLQVNHPLWIGSTKVHLLGHGYAADVSVRDGNGKVAYSGPVVFLPQDGNFTSVGVIKAPDARPSRLAFQGFFLPTGAITAGGPTSLFPDALNPQLYLTAWYGKPAVETGVPSNIYTLDTTGMTQLISGKDKTRFVLSPGQEYTLPEGKGTIQFNGWQRWAKIQVSQTPGLPLAFLSVLLAVAGLCLSLFSRSRRVWVRTIPDDDGLKVEIGGLDRNSSRSGAVDDVNSLLAAIGGSRMSGDIKEDQS